MKEYDFAFSLGFACVTSQVLRENGLQFVSLPLDWVGSQGLMRSIEMVEGDFHGWFERNDLRLNDVRYTGGHAARVYRSEKTGFLFPHDFTNAEPIETSYEERRAIYDRRIDRMLSILTHARRIFAFYVEHPEKPRESDEILKDARNRLCRKFPNADIDLAYAFEDSSVDGWHVEGLSAGVDTVRLDYRILVNGEVSHECRREQLGEYVRSVARIKDTRSDDEKRRFEESRRRGYLKLLGSTPYERWRNRKLKRWFRDLELYLQGQGLLPRDRLLEFDAKGLSRNERI